MKSQVFVLIPYDVAPSEIGDFERLLLEKHRLNPLDLVTPGRYDYLVGALEKSLSDPIADGRLPPKVRRTFSGNICERANLPTDIVPAALVTPDGEWHDISDFGWAMTREPSAENRAARIQWTSRYRELIAAHQDCWVVEVWAHS